EKYGPTVDGLYVTDHAGALQEWHAGLGFRISVAGPSELDVEHKVDVERFAGVDLTQRLTSAELTSDRLHWLGFDARYVWGTGVNFDPAPGLSPFLARAREATLSATFRPTPRLSLAQTWIYNGLHGLDGPGGGGSIFDNVILRTKLNAQ